MEARLELEEGTSPTSVYMVTLGQTLVIGSGPRADIQLNDPQLAERHAAVQLKDDGLQIIDLGAPGGTLLDGTPLPVRKPTTAGSGAELRLGGFAFRVTVEGLRRRPRPRGEAVFPAAEFTDVQLIGRGATGKVYRAVWRPRNLVVALKLMREEILPGTPDHERFVRECGTVSRLQCPYIVSVFDLRSEQGRTYSILELVEGAPLERLLERGPLAVPDALRVAEDVARALAVAAAHGIVHRDVKPANVLLSSTQGVAKLCDFGLAKDLESTLYSLTAHGLGMGTLAYIPPEQVAGAKLVDAHADVYSLGATLYHALAGVPPFSPESPDALRSIQTDPPPRLEGLRSGLPPEVASLVHALLAKRPADRPWPGQVVDALADVRVRLYPGHDSRTLFAPGWGYSA